MNEKTIVIVGGGGHTRALIGVLRKNGAPIQGIVTRDESLLGGEILGCPVLGLETAYPLDPAAHAIVVGFGNKATRNGSDTQRRASIYRRYVDAGFVVAEVVSGDAIVQPEARIGAGAQIMPGAVIQAAAIIGENVILNTGCVIDHDSVVGAHAHVAPGAVLCGDVTIGEGAHIGAGAIVIEGIRIGRDAVIGAGVTVRSDVQEGAVVVR